MMAGIGKIDVASAHGVTQDLLTLKAIITVRKHVEDLVGNRWQERKKLSRLCCLFGA